MQLISHKISYFMHCNKTSLAYSNLIDFAIDVAVWLTFSERTQNFSKHNILAALLPRLMLSGLKTTKMFSLTYEREFSSKQDVVTSRF